MQSITANDLPAEVWNAIAVELAWIERSHRTAASANPNGFAAGNTNDIETKRPGFPCKYMSVNRRFFDYYLDTFYEEVQWTRWDQATLKQLERLQSPIIANHVRRLQIQAWFIDSLMRRDIANPKSKSFKQLLETIRTKFRGGFGTPDAHFRASDIIEKRADSGLSRKSYRLEDATSETLLRLMTQAIKSMENVVVYRLELRDLTLTSHTQRLLSMTKVSFGSNLRKLALHTSVFKFKSALDSTGLQDLEELELNLEYHSTNAPDDTSQAKAVQDEARELQETVLGFINTRKAVLRSLTLISFSSVDLTPFFRGLGPFVVLRRFSIRLCLDEAHLSDVDSLVQFLSTHRSCLAHVDIRLLTPEAPPSPNATTRETPEVATTRRARSWIRLQKALVAQCDVLRSLEGLHIPLGNINDCIALISRSAHSLVHLSLTDHFFSSARDDAELKKVLRPFARNPFQLKSVHVEVEILSLGCLKALARSLPDLRALVVVFDTVYTPDIYNRNQVADPLHYFGQKGYKERMSTLNPGELDWPNLEHITVLARRHMILSPEDAALLNINPTYSTTDTGIYSTYKGTEDTYMKPIAEKVPSVRSYRGAWWHRRDFAL